MYTTAFLEEAIFSINMGATNEKVKSLLGVNLTSYVNKRLLVGCAFDISHLVDRRASSWHLNYV